MKNFLKIAAGVDVVPLLLALQHRPDLWDAENVRKTFSETSPHREVSDILLRFSEPTDGSIGDQLLCEFTPAFYALPPVREIVFGLMNRVHGVMLGRVMITRLAPGKRIYPHSDVLGIYANTYKRFHLALQSEPGNVFTAGDEQVYMRAGEIWDFNAHAEHAIVNNSADDRLHLIIDIKT